MKKLIKILTFLNLSLAFLLLILALFIYYDSNKNLIHENIYVKDICLSSLTKTQAVKILNDKYNFKRDLILKHNNKIYNINLKNYDFYYNIEKIVDSAYNIGRNGNFIQNIYTILGLHFGENVEIDLDYNHNFKSLESDLIDLTSNLNIMPIDAQILIDKNKISHIKEKNGTNVDIEKLIIDIKTLCEKGFNEKELEIPIIETYPKIKLKTIEKINKKIATYSTRYSTKYYSRAKNISIASEKINNLLVFPGEEVSFNEKMGDITWENGFRYAKIIFNGEYINGIGGGICQVSSTLYNSLLFANLEIIERHRHTKPSSYVPYNRDATVSPPTLDLKFRNNKEFPIYIRTIASKGIITSEIYSTEDYK